MRSETPYSCPWVYRTDLSISQDLFTTIAGRRNGLQLRADILNVGNLINRNWGTGQRFTTTQPLIAQGADEQGRVQYRLRNIGDQLISESFQPTASPADVFRVQLGLRYTFN